MVKHTEPVILSKSDNEKLVDIFTEVLNLIKSRNEDVYLVDGDFATVDVDTLIHLEQSFKELLGLPVSELKNLDRIRWRVRNLEVNKYG